MARHYGRDRPQESRSRHHPPRSRHQHGQQLHSRLRCPGNRRLRNQLFLLRPRTDLTRAIDSRRGTIHRAPLSFRYLVTSLLHFFYNPFYGPPPRTRPHSPCSRRSHRLCRRPTLLRRQASVPSWPSPRRYRPPRRTEHFLLSHRHLPGPQRRTFSASLALLPFPPLIIGRPNRVSTPPARGFLSPTDITCPPPH